MKKIVVLIMLSIFSFGLIHAEITWNLSDDGTLTISGTDMPDYSEPDYAPWYFQIEKIKKIVIENGVKNIGNNAFRKCTSFTFVTIPNSVTSIGELAFYSCSGLTSITIPNSVTSIGKEAFYGCSGLTSLTIPNSVTSIGSIAFGGCSGLTSIIVEKGSAYYDSRDYCNAIIETKSNTLINGCKNTVIPHSVTSIGEFAFHSCSSLISITIPNSVTSIGKLAFFRCFQSYLRHYP